MIPQPPAPSPALIWYPAEVNVSIRPGWFYHAAEDGAVRPLDELMRMYMQSVGNNAVFLLNVPPDVRGRIHESDADRLAELGAAIGALTEVDWVERLGAAGMEAIGETTTTTNDSGAIPYEGISHPSERAAPLRHAAAIGVIGLSPDGPARFLATAQEEGHEAVRAAHADPGCWKAPDGVESASLLVMLGAPRSLRCVVLQEDLALGQRIEAFRVRLCRGGADVAAFEGTTVGYKRICAFDDVLADAVVVDVLQSRIAPTLRFVGVYGGAV